MYMSGMLYLGKEGRGVCVCMGVCVCIVCVFLSVHGGHL